MTLYKWSTNAANNATADSTCPFPEGMAASALNDGSRGQMAAVAKYRDDIAGVIVTGGTSTAYTIFSNQGFTSFVQLHGAMICFTPHTTNGANGTGLNVDGLGIKPILTAPGAGLPGAVLVQGTPYAVTYNNTDGAFYVHGFFNDPYNVPLLGGMDYWDTVTPNSSFIFPNGQAISRTTYSAAFARWGTKFGVGDGATTFNVPNKAGKVSAMIEPAALLLTAGFFGGDSTLIGTVGGSEKHTLVTANLPAYTPSGSVAVSVSPGNVQRNAAGAVIVNQGSGFNVPQTDTVGNSATATFTGTAQGGTSSPARTVQPTITCNYIIRII